MRGGFTLIEVTLAVVMGAVLLAAAVAMFTTIERADAAATRRADEAFQLERVQRAVVRAMGSLLIATREELERAEAARRALEEGVAPPEDDPAADDDAGQGQAGQEGQPGPPDTGPADDTAELEEQLEALRPRVLLETDPALEGLVMTRRVRIGDSGLGPPQTTLPQRLELALSAPPVTPGAEDLRRRWEIADLGADPLEVGESVDDRGAVRGAFVFRDEGRFNDLGLRVFSLWWRPIAADALEAMAQEEQAIDPAVIDGSVLLMDSLVWARWRFFKERQWRESFSAVGEIDLAAYAELELTTAQNTTHSWIFELAWTLGVDPTSEDEGDPADDQDADAEDREGPDPDGDEDAPRGGGRGGLGGGA